MSCMYEELVLLGYDEWDGIVYAVKEKYPKAVVGEEDIKLGKEVLAEVREEDYTIILKIKKGIL